jgi:hypothetical protein
MKLGDHIPYYAFPDAPHPPEPEPECDCEDMCPACRREYRGKVNRWRGLRLTGELTEGSFEE